MPLPHQVERVTRQVSPDYVRRTTLMFADPPPVPLPPLEQVRTQPVLPTGVPEGARYPWENLAFEGGGAKGYAYIGAVQVLEQAGIYPQQIRRVAGTSVGSILALFAAVGASSDYMRERVPADLPGLVMDGSGGRLGSALRTAVTRGMHPGQRSYDFLGEVLEEYTGSPDVTFKQLLERCGRELCVAVTNVNRMMTEYCHTKTTPNMPVRVAVRMSMSLPVLLQPVLLAKHGDDADLSGAEVYVDGGLMCNNPTHAFDGWWLSLEPEDAFLRKLQPLERAADSYPRAMRFSPENPRTLGFTLFSSDEADLTRGWVRPGGGPPPRPTTPAVEAFESVERHRDTLSRLQKPLQRLLSVLDDFDLNQDGVISEQELSAAIEAGDISSVELLSIFGTTSPAEIFAAVNRDENNLLDFGELVQFIESVGVDVTTQLVGFPARPPTSLLGFASNLLDAMSRDLTRANHAPGDRERTIPIGTDYVTTQTFDLASQDLEFLLDSARRATRAFLLEYDELHGAQRAT